MSRRHTLDQRLRKLGEIGEIMRSMKNLALMETRKLARLLDTQRESVRLIETAAADFLLFHPRFAAQSKPDSRRALLVIGAERGFCGDFNEELLAGLRPDDSTLLAVGSKLCLRLEHHPGISAAFEGPAVAEDVAATLNRLVPAIGRLREGGDGLAVDVLYHRSGALSLERKPLLPPFAEASTHPLTSLNAPLLNLPPAHFFAEMVRHYLFAVLHEIFNTSLMAENQRRIQHLEGAIQRLEEKTADFTRLSRTLRQEEITEEIEVILLGVEEASKPKRRIGR
jgi:F-type H+-transporting ATPase subunit gamma